MKRDLTNLSYLLTEVDFSETPTQVLQTLRDIKNSALCNVNDFIYWNRVDWIENLIKEEVSKINSMEHGNGVLDFSSVLTNATVKEAFGQEAVEYMYNVLLSFWNRDNEVDDDDFLDEITEEDDNLEFAILSVEDVDDDDDETDLDDDLDDMDGDDFTDNAEVELDDFDDLDDDWDDDFGDD